MKSIRANLETHDLQCQSKESEINNRTWPILAKNQQCLFDILSSNSANWIYLNNGFWFSVFTRTDTVKFRQNLDYFNEDIAV